MTVTVPSTKAMFLCVIHPCRCPERVGQAPRQPQHPEQRSCHPQGSRPAAHTQRLCRGPRRAPRLHAQLNSSSNSCLEAVSCGNSSCQWGSSSSVRAARSSIQLQQQQWLGLMESSSSGGGGSGSSVFCWCRITQVFFASQRQFDPAAAVC